MTEGTDRAAQRGRGTAERRWPLTAAQSGIWFGHELDTTGRRYNVGQYVQLHGALDEGCFEKALRAAMADSESLLVRFARTSEGIIQILDPDAAGRPPHRVDLSSHPDPSAAAQRHIAALYDVPYDLTAAPPFDHHLIRTGATEYLWCIKMHHLLVDGVAMAALIRRVAAAYTALCAGEPLPGGRFDSLDTLVAEDRAYRRSDRFRSDAAFWAERLTGAGRRPTSPPVRSRRTRRSICGTARGWSADTGRGYGNGPRRGASAGRPSSRRRPPWHCTPTPGSATSCSAWRYRHATAACAGRRWARSPTCCRYGCASTRRRPSRAWYGPWRRRPGTSCATSATAWRTCSATPPPSSTSTGSSARGST
ncbi:hypothetical protein SRIMM317S_05584 [Streptomyces rimosus subsp. rimosus]